jgi:hypothetical protein
VHDHATTAYRNHRRTGDHFIDKSVQSCGTFVEEIRSGLFREAESGTGHSYRCGNPLSFDKFVDDRFRGQDMAVLFQVERHVPGRRMRGGIERMALHISGE